MAALSGSARADSWRPLAVALDCQSWGRVDACTYVQRFIDSQDVLAAAPRAQADVVVYINITQQAMEDLVQLRCVPERPELGGVIEQVAVVDSQLGVDEQRGVLEPVFLRGLAPYLLRVAPESVSVSLDIPDAGEAESIETSPWGAEAWGGGFGWWTEDYQDYSLWAGASLYRITDDARLDVNISQDTSIQRQPPLTVDGQSVSRASYAEPLSINSSLNLRIFWANTNGARNNRFSTARNQGATANL